MQPLHGATDRLGVDVCLAKNLESGPSCPHGPMLLFERFYKAGRSPRRFYACSAARDRKDCSFFQWEDEKVSEARAKAHKELIKAFKIPFLEACDIYTSLLQSSNFKKLKCAFCHSCGLLVLPKHEERHQAHDVEQVKELSKPSKILRPKENERTQAQYLFSNKSSHFLISLIKDLGFKNVLCLGTPRLHEEIQFMSNWGGDEKQKLDSLLLDIDYRYAQFFPSTNFCWYNMFNHFFFGNHASERTFSTFLQREAVVLVMDPPFGGLAEVLSATVSKIWSTWRQSLNTDADARDQKEELPTMWIFPYFMESHIKKSLPSLTMMDYKVDYDNHPHFKSRSMKGSKRGSPVRIFTNIVASKIVLPADEGYRFCKSCSRYVAPENVHCTKCNGCMSKDGRQYVHCDLCETCVKPGRQHCFTCRRCETQGHRCDGPVKNGCHICGKVGHKRRECPNRSLEPAKKRRKKAEGVKVSHCSTAQVHTQKRNAKMNRKTKKIK